MLVVVVVGAEVFDGCMHIVVVRISFVDIVLHVVANLDIVIAVGDLVVVMVTSVAVVMVSDVVICVVIVA